MAKLHISRSYLPKEITCMAETEDFPTIQEFLEELNKPEGREDFGPLREVKVSFKLALMNKPNLMDGITALIGFKPLGECLLYVVFRNDAGAFTAEPYEAKRLDELEFVPLEGEPDPATPDDEPELVTMDEMEAMRLREKGRLN